MKIVKVRLSDKMIADLKAHAEAEGTTVSAAIRELLAKALDNQSLREAQAELASIVDTASEARVGGSGRRSEPVCSEPPIHDRP